MATAEADRSDYDVIVSGGLYFDGLGSAPDIRDLGIRSGRVVQVSPQPLIPGPATRVVPAQGRWVMPGIRRHPHPLRRRDARRAATW